MKAKHLSRSDWRASQVADKPNRHAIVIHARIVNDNSYLDKLALLDTVHSEIDPQLDAKRQAEFGLPIPATHDRYRDLMDKVLTKLAVPDTDDDSDLTFDPLSANYDSGIVPVLYSELSRV